MNSFDAQDYLGTFTNFESRLSNLNPQSFNLDRVRRLFRVLGDPQKQLTFIHVAGTKGKGSTCAFTAYILRAAGYRVGLYTSPHLYRVQERIRVLEAKASPSELKEDFYGAIRDKELDVLVEKFRKAIDKIRNDAKLGNLTYFEVLTGLALVYFAQRNTDIVILETGLGGRLDATNVVDALVNGITPISLDHTAQLGTTLEKIAGEKAAIIKNSQSKVVVGLQPVQAMKVIRGQCRTLGIKPWIIGKDIRCQMSGKTFSTLTPNGECKKLSASLAGEHQVHNAAMAVGMVELSGFKITAKAVAQGLRETRWPGRFEMIDKDPAVIVDCAHNPASAEVVMQSLRRSVSKKKVILVLGLSNDKDIRGICQILGKNARLIVTTQSRHPRAYLFSHQELKSLFKDKPAFNVQSIAEALTIARREAARNEVILITGSVFIAAEARAFLKRMT